MTGCLLGLSVPGFVDGYKMSALPLPIDLPNAHKARSDREDYNK